MNIKCLFGFHKWIIDDTRFCSFFIFYKCKYCNKKINTSPFSIKLTNKIETLYEKGKKLWSTKD